jgi:hypothetical protein
MKNTPTMSRDTIYQNELDEFTKHRAHVQQAQPATLDKLQSQWLAAATSAATRLELPSTQVKAILHIPADNPLTSAATIAQLPNAAEIFYRMTTFMLVAENLTATLKGNMPRERHWMTTRHTSGPYAAQSPLDTITNAGKSALRSLQDYIV